MAGSNKTLVVGPAWVGDMVMAHALFRLLRLREPDILIDVIAPPWSGPLVARMPEVRRCHALAVGHGELGLVARWRLGRALRREQYERAIVLPRAWKAALVPFIARVPWRTGFRGEMRYWLLNDIRPLDTRMLDQTVKRFIALGLPPAERLPEPPPPKLGIDVSNRNAVLERLGLEAPTRLVVLMPGAAYGPAKCWPLDYFAELATALLASGASIWVLGSAAEAPAGATIRAAAGPGVRNLCGETGLEDTVDLLSLARVAVTNDSGLMHVAAAAGTHVVAVYGSTTPAFTPPLTAARSIHYLNLECSPCFRRECPLGHLRCLRDIGPAAVAESVRNVLQLDPKRLGAEC